VARADYRRLYAAAVRYHRATTDYVEPPILPDDQVTTLWKNTIGYLDETNLRRIREFGGRPKRGLLLTGPPGNGKTSACRWLWHECRKRNWEWRLVTADAYAEARRECNPEQAVRELFTVERTGIVFFDDMDQALRNRDTVKETDDQSVFLNALDGIEIREGVAYVFTTNCALDLIDRAFKRPGRIDIVMHFGLPTADLRRRLFDRWHDEIRNHLSIDDVIGDTDGMSFAEMDEVKNLLVMHFVNTDEWDWPWAMEQFASNRQDFAATRRVGFAFESEARTERVLQRG
jgi:cell division protease FtsH